MKFFYLLFFSILWNCSIGQRNFIISIKYIPFSLESRVSINENDINNIYSLDNYLQVKYDTIKDNKISWDIFCKIQNIVKQKSFINENYSLRIMCKLIKLNKPIDSFFIDNYKRIIYNKKVLDKSVEITNLILHNICRPIYSFMPLERHYWPNTPCCNDTIEFKKNFPDIPIKEYLKY